MKIPFYIRTRLFPKKLFQYPITETMEKQKLNGGLNSDDNETVKNGDLRDLPNVKLLNEVDKYIKESDIRLFIRRWEDIIYPYKESNDQHRAIKAILTELEMILTVCCR